LHDEYGPIVRVAPNEVICNSGEAFDAVYSALSSHLIVLTGKLIWQQRHPEHM
jgi:hypothetical protein